MENPMTVDFDIYNQDGIPHFRVMVDGLLTNNYMYTREEVWDFIVYMWNDKETYFTLDNATYLLALSWVVLPVNNTRYTPWKRGRVPEYLYN